MNFNLPVEICNTWFVWYFAGEAAHLAADFDYVCESEFPAAQLAERQYRQHAEPTEQQSRKNAIIAAKYVSS